jgi:uncharacterized protein (TIGR03663 family)
MPVESVKENRVNRETSLNTNAQESQNFLSGKIKLNWEVMAFIAILLLAVFTRFYILGERVMSHDESLHTRFSYNLYNEGDFRHTPLMHGPILFHATAFSYYLFGDNDFTSRIYTSVLGVLMVMSPWLFRRWLGRWGVVLASTMLLISPLILYYNRYIRHDTPSIMAALLMMWAIMMYINGPLNQRRRAHWLYIIAFAMIWNLGSKETAFIYIAIFGIFLALYFAVRLIQHFFDVPGKPIFYMSMIGILLGGVMSLGLYIIYDIIQFDLIPNAESVLFSSLTASDQSIFFQWVILTVISVSLVMLMSLLWAYRGRLSEIKWAEVALVGGIMLAVAFVLLILEEVSHTTPTGTEPVTPTEPGSEGAGVGIGGLRWFPMIAIWLISAGTLVFLSLVRRRPENGEKKDKAGRGFWGTMDLFPEFDLIIVIGTLILPWATAFVPYLMRGSSADFVNLANSLPPILNNIIMNVPDINTAEQVGQVFLSFMAWFPLMFVSIAIGIAWNWRRWIVASLIFHVIFAFFFTTVFTNIAGLASGMVYSLGYWLEQQGVRRGSQPQYYYLLIIMPMYEYLPVIGGVLAMFAGMVVFWRQRLSANFQHQTILNRLRMSQQPDIETTSDDESGVSASSTIERPNQDVVLQELHAHRQEQRLEQIPFLIFFAWLAILNLVGYSLAGEKMPWLGTHLTMPLIFLTAWFFGRIFKRIDLRRVIQNGWILYIILPIATITGIQVIAPLLIGEQPFAGLAQDQLQRTYNWLASLVIFLAMIGVVIVLIRRLEWRFVRRQIAVVTFVLLSLVTFRASWMASFINYDDPTEFLVYAHAAPAIKTVLNQIEEFSLRSTDGYELRFAYDNEVSWPYSWYFRNYPNAVFIGDNPTVQNLEDTMIVVVGDGKRSRVEPILEDRYQRFDYKRLWWPMQDYFYLTPDRILNTFDFSADNATANQIRRGLVDIWWSRDYTTYGQALSKSFALTEWPVSDTMHVYIRKDFASQIWEYGVGDGTVLNPLEDIEQNLCSANWVTPEAIQVIESPLGLSRPLQMTIDSEGNLYVAEEGASRITVFDENGEYLNVLGGAGSEPGMFTRPNSVAYDADADYLFVADTWNYRIQALDTDGNPITAWGEINEAGFSAQALPTDGFWGPRDVYVDNGGRIYVSDTGNKRIRVYALEGQEAVFLFDVGSGGSGLGELDEPNGVLVHPDDGRIIVADTWNRRISIFSNTGQFVESFSVRGWYGDLNTLPYLALDAERDLLYMTDSDAGRVLVYDMVGNCVGALGQSSTVASASGFNLLGGITVDDEGYIYVSDAGTGRILKFEPFPLNQSSDTESDASMPESGEDVSEDDAIESNPDMPSETTPEVTAEAVG